MKRKTLALTFVWTLLISAAAGTQIAHFSSANFFPDPGPDLPRIYIRNDGNVEPATVPIKRTGNIYRLTGDIVLYTIEIQRNNVVLDGAGYTIQGNASRIKGYDNGNNGVIMVGRNNVSITRLNLEQGDTGVRVLKSSNVNIIGNTFSNGLNRGISLQGSTHVMIEDNDFINIWSDSPSVSCNGSTNTIINNRLTGSARGITMEGSLNVISDNRIEAVLPIIVDKANSNIIAGNTITGPAIQNYTGGEGIALFVNCSNNIIFGNNITRFNGQAIRTVFACSNNTICGNYMANNAFAIALQKGAVNNKFYGNNFAADSCKVRINDAEGNFWDNGTIGNYWGNYNGADSNGDGIGDTSYIVVGYKWDNKVGGDVSFVADQDNYPLMTPFNLTTIILPDWANSIYPAALPLMFPTPTPAPSPSLSSTISPSPSSTSSPSLEPTQIPETCSILPITVASVAIVAVVGTGLLVYFKKRKRQVERL